jgi:hypothetical protein
VQLIERGVELLRGRWVSHWGEVASVIGEVASVIDVRAPANLLGEKRRASDRSSFATLKKKPPLCGRRL